MEQVNEFRRGIAERDHGHDYCFTPFALKRHRCLLRNNFESIIIDIRDLGDLALPANVLPGGDIIETVAHCLTSTLFPCLLSLIRGSPKPFRLIVSVAEENWATDDFQGRISEHLSIQPILDPNHVGTGRTWIWDSGEKTLKPMPSSTRR